MKPTVHILGIHLPGKKIVLTAGSANAVANVYIPTPLQRHFGRLTDGPFDRLTYLEQHS
jgi:hypothetical protein